MLIIVTNIMKMEMVQIKELIQTELQLQILHFLISNV